MSFFHRRPKQESTPTKDPYIVDEFGNTITPAQAIVNEDQESIRMFYVSGIISLRVRDGRQVYVINSTDRPR